MPSYIQRPALWLFLAALAGALLGSQLPLTWLLPTHALAVVCLVWAWLGRKTSLAIILLLLGTGLAYASLAVAEKQVSPSDISYWGERREITLTGRLAQGPRPASWPGFWQGVLACTRARWQDVDYPASGRVRFRVPGQPPAWLPGDELRLTGRLQQWEGPANPAEFNLAEYYGRKGLRAALKVYFPQDITRSRRGSVFSWAALAGRCRQWLSAGLRSSCLSPHRGLVAAVVLADRSGLTSWDKALLANAGLSHLLALSGLHAGIIFSLVFGTIRLLGGSSRLAMIGGLAGTAAYAIIMGAQTPLVRATLMIAGMVGAGLAGRKSDPLSGLACAGLILLGFRPLAVLTAGFQLSFSATATILMIWPRLENFKQRLPRILRGPAVVMLVSAAIVANTAPLTLYHFYSITPVAIVANLAALPLLFAILSSGLLAAGVSQLWLPAGMAFAWISAQAAGLLHALAYGVLWFPGPALYLWPPPAWWIAGSYALLLLAGARPWAWRGWILAGVAWCLLYPRFQPDPLLPDETRLTFLALDIGEATLLETGAGSRWLIDCGTEQEFLWRVKPFLASRGIRRLSGLLLSHLDQDHAGGARACLALFRVDQVLTAAAYQDLVRALLEDPAGTRRLAKQYARLSRGEEWRLDPGCAWEVLWPPPGGLSGRNHECLAVCLITPGGNVLFTGDSPGKVERQWQLPASCLVLKAGHHGDKEASTFGLLAQCQPEVAVVTPGTRNAFGLPDPETLRRLQRAGAVVLNTKACGAVQVSLRPNRPPQWQTWLPTR